jgi:hypothetical protein
MARLNAANVFSGATAEAPRWPSINGIVGMLKTNEDYPIFHFSFFIFHFSFPIGNGPSVGLVHFRWTKWQNEK